MHRCAIIFLGLAIASGACTHDTGQVPGLPDAGTDLADDAAPTTDVPPDMATEGPGDGPVTPERPILPVLPEETVGRASLVAYWPLDEGEGLNTWDVTGNANDGVFLPVEYPDLAMGPQWRNEGFPGALFHNPSDVSFDGADDYIEFQQRTLPEIGLPLSISLWARYDDDVSPDLVASLFVMLNRVAGAGLRIELRLQRLRVATYLSTNDSPELVGAPAPGPGWHHIAYTFDGTTHALYVDDAPPVTSTFVTSERGKPDRCRLGRTRSGLADAFKGFMDDVRVYDRALTPAEVGSLRGGAP
jgi:hypothetical protein